MRKGKSIPSLCHCILRPLYFRPKTWDRNWEDFLKCAYIDFPPQKSCQLLFPTRFKILESKTLSHYLFNGWLRVCCHFSSQSQWIQSTFTHLPYSCTMLSLQETPRNTSRWVNKCSARNCTGLEEWIKGIGFRRRTGILWSPLNLATTKIRKAGSY